MTCDPQGKPWEGGQVIQHLMLGTRYGRCTLKVGPLNRPHFQNTFNTPFGQVELQLGLTFSIAFRLTPPILDPAKLSSRVPPSSQPFFILNKAPFLNDLNDNLKKHRAL